MEEELRYLEFMDIGLDQNLAAAISVRFARKSLIYYEYDNFKDRRLRNAVEMIERWILGVPISEAKLVDCFNEACSAYDESPNFGRTDNIHAADVVVDSFCIIIPDEFKVEHFRIQNYEMATINSCFFFDSNDEILKILPLILRYKIENGCSFASPDLIFEHLSDDDKFLFVLNMGTLR